MRPTVWSPVSEVKDISTHGAMPLHLQQLLGTGTYQVSWVIRRLAYYMSCALFSFAIVSFTFVYVPRSLVRIQTRFHNLLPLPASPHNAYPHHHMSIGRPTCCLPVFLPLYLLLSLDNASVGRTSHCHVYMGTRVTSRKETKFVKIVHGITPCIYRLITAVLVPRTQRAFRPFQEELQH